MVLLESAHHFSHWAVVVFKLRSYSLPLTTRGKRRCCPIAVNVCQLMEHAEVLLRSFYMTQLASGHIMHIWPAVVFAFEYLCNFLAYTQRLSHEALAASFSATNHSLYEVRYCADTAARIVAMCSKYLIEAFELSAKRYRRSHAYRQLFLFLAAKPRTRRACALARHTRRTSAPA